MKLQKAIKKSAIAIEGLLIIGFFIYQTPAHINQRGNNFIILKGKNKIKKPNTTNAKNFLLNEYF